MNIQFFSYTDNDGLSYADAKNMILNRFSAEDESSFKDYSDIADLFGALESSLDSADVLVITASPPLYNDLKSTMNSAFGFQSETNLAIKSALGDTLLSEDVFEAHCTVPSNSVVLLSLDGMYSGFYVESQSQYIVLLPLDEDRLGHILDNSQFPFVGDGSANDDTNHSEPETQVPKEYIDEAFSVIRLLRENSQKVAAPAAPASENLKSILINCDNYEEHFRFTPHIEDRGEQKPGEYAAQIAKISRELAGADIGVSISDIYETANENGVSDVYTFICVADERKAIVRKLYANPDESESDLLRASAFELILLIKKTALELATVKEALYTDKTDISTDETDDDDDDDEFAEDEFNRDEEYDGRPVGKISKKGMIAALVIIILALMASIFVGLKLTGAFDGLFSKEDATTDTQNSETVPAHLTADDNSVIKDIDPNHTLDPSATADLTNVSSTVTNTTPTPTPTPTSTPTPTPTPTTTEPTTAKTTTTTTTTEPTTAKTTTTTTTTTELTTTTTTTQADETPDE